MKAIASYTTTMITMIPTMTIIVSLVAGPPRVGAISPAADSLGLVSPAPASAAQALHVGMSKRFHLRAGNAITGKITDNTATKGDNQGRSFNPHCQDLFDDIFEHGKAFGFFT